MGRSEPYDAGDEEEDCQNRVCPLIGGFSSYTYDIRDRDLCRSDPIFVHRASRVADPPIIGERARSPYQFVNVYVKESK